jgi:sec-independent protein translocase protein TatC
MLEARVSEYLSLSLQIILAFGISFQSPVILMIFEKIGIISVETLRSKRRIAIVIIFIIAAIITPPDVLSQIILATLMILLYELAILGCTLQNKGKRKNA